MQRYEIISIIKGMDKKKVHISLNNRRFYNGVVLEFDEECLSFVEDKLGYINILYSMIINVEPFVGR